MIHDHGDFDDISPEASAVLASPDHRRKRRRHSQTRSATETAPGITTVSRPISLTLTSMLDAEHGEYGRQVQAQQADAPHSPRLHFGPCGSRRQTHVLCSSP